jgi:hypothetical protein
MARRADPWSVRGLRERCELLRTDIEAKRLASPQELDAYTPGGQSNPKAPGRGPWIFCYANFVRFRGRSEFREASRAGAEGVALRILAAEPETVATEGLPDGAPAPLQVHQKSAWALGHLAAHDIVLARLQAHLGVLQDDPATESAALVVRAQERLAEELALCVWAVTHPGPGLPWDPAQADTPAAPLWVRSLDAFTVLRIQRTHQRVNGTNLAALKVLLAPDPDAGDRESRTLFAGLFASVAAELGFTPDQVIRERPLLQLLAQLQLKASVRREAEQAAKQKADADKARGGR